MLDDKFTLEDVRNILDALVFLNLPKAPNLASEAEKQSQAEHWYAELSRFNRRHLRNLWPYIRVKCKFYPTIAQVMEQLQLLEDLDHFHALSENENYKMIDEIDGVKITPIAIRSATLKAAMIRQYGERGAELPVVNFGTGDITWQGKKIGNAIKEYGWESRINKLKEKNKNVGQAQAQD